MIELCILFTNHRASEAILIGGSLGDENIGILKVLNTARVTEIVVTQTQSKGQVRPHLPLILNEKPNGGGLGAEAIALQFARQRIASSRSAREWLVAD